MRVGVVILPQFDRAETCARWKALEDMGFASGWTYDHLAWRELVDEPWYGTVPTLAAAAFATERLRLGTWVLSPNFRHPVVVAKDLMTLDELSGGRIVAAVGAGGLGWDSAVLGQPPLSPKQLMDRLIEFVTLSDLLLRQPVTSWSGDWFSAVDARMIPGCVQRPRLPLVVASSGPRGIRFAAAAGDGWATHGPPGVTTQDEWWAGLTRQVSVLDEALDGHRIERYLSIDGGPLLSMRSEDSFVDAAGRAAALGFDEVVAHWPRESLRFVGDPAVLEQVAGQLDGTGHIRL